MLPIWNTPEICYGTTTPKQTTREDRMCLESNTSTFSCVTAFREVQFGESEPKFKGACSDPEYRPATFFKHMILIPVVNSYFASLFCEVACIKSV